MSGDLRTGHNQGRMTPDEFVAQVVVEIPEFSGAVAEHLDDYDGLLLHLLMADLLRFSTAAFGTGNRELADRCLRLVERALLEGDEAVDNAVALSYVDGVGAWPGETPEFIASWPRGLLAEKARQDSWRQAQS